MTEQITDFFNQFPNFPVFGLLGGMLILVVYMMLALKGPDTL